VAKFQIGDIIIRKSTKSRYEILDTWQLSTGTYYALWSEKSKTLASVCKIRELNMYFIHDPILNHPFWRMLYDTCK